MADAKLLSSVKGMEMMGAPTSDQSYAELHVRTSIGDQFTFRDVPHDTTPYDLLAALAERYPDTFVLRPNVVVDLVVDSVTSRLELSAALGGQGVSDGANLDIASTAGGGGFPLESMLEAAGGAALLPFLTAFVTKAGQDAYDQVRKLITPGKRAHAKAQIVEQGDVTIVDVDAKIVLRIQGSTSRPAEVGEPDPPTLPLRSERSRRKHWILYAWNPASREWERYRIDAPPADGIELHRRAVERNHP
jgi:hypothetical protein